MIQKIGYKIREHSTSKIPVIIVIGKKEIENKTVSVRRLGIEKTETFKTHGSNKSHTCSCRQKSLRRRKLVFVGASSRSDPSI